jgi:hypothetical protein
MKVPLLRLMEGSLTSAYRVENTTLVRSGDDMLRFRYGAESEV